MNDKQVKKLLVSGKEGKFRVGNGLYFRVTKEKTGLWFVRYSSNGRRPEITIGRYGKNKDDMSLADAREKAAEIMSTVRAGKDPLVEKRLQKRKNLTVNQVAKLWLEQKKRNVQNAQILTRVYENDIAPILGNFLVKDVSPLEVEEVLVKIAKSGRPTVANDALSYCKQIFKHAVNRELIQFNPAASLSYEDAGGEEKPRSRKLELSEIRNVFSVLENNSKKFTRDNYIAVALLLLLGVRKGELIAAKWSEINLNQAIWTIPAERVKTEVEFKIPLSDTCIELFSELNVRAGHSDYVFPARKTSMRRDYISDDTLNHALANLFGKKRRNKKANPVNHFAKYNIEHFTIHDLRRTFRTLLSKLRVPPHVAERCLNHKLKGVEGTYDHYDYFDERKEALEKLSDAISEFISIKPWKKVAKNLSINQSQN